MSFVYAEISDGVLDVHCDTKIELDSSSGASFSREQMTLILKYGIVKTTIICPEISISFAGNRFFRASELFGRLFEKKTYTTEEVVDIAYNIHMMGDINDIEFIVASCEGGILSLHCIKEHKIIEDCPFVWIGSSVAHQEFQKIRNNNNKGKASDRTGTAFLEIVQSCSDKSVGGFHITAGYNPSEKTMCYRECRTFQNSKPVLVQLGEEIPFYISAEDGDFSFGQIPISIEDMIFKIDQMNSAVLFSRRLRMNEFDMNNHQLFSLMLPMLIHEDGNGGWIRV